MAKLEGKLVGVQQATPFRAKSNPLELSDLWVFMENLSSLKMFPFESNFF